MLALQCCTCTSTSTAARCPLCLDNEPMKTSKSLHSRWLNHLPLPFLPHIKYFQVTIHSLSIHKYSSRPIKQVSKFIILSNNTPQQPKKLPILTSFPRYLLQTTSVYMCILVPSYCTPEVLPVYCREVYNIAQIHATITLLPYYRYGSDLL